VILEKKLALFPTVCRDNSLADEPSDMFAGKNSTRITIKV